MLLETGRWPLYLASRGVLRVPCSGIRGEDGAEVGNAAGRGGDALSDRPLLTRGVQTPARTPLAQESLLLVGQCPHLLKHFLLDQQ